MIDLRVGQTWQLADGSVVTVLSLPDEAGWLRCLSHETDREGTYNVYGFVQPAARLVELKKHGRRKRA